MGLAERCGGCLVWGRYCQVLPSCWNASSALGRVSAQSADTVASPTGWERGRVKADSREAGARKREP